eukprot:3792694-Prymnesium_polylepis.2
MWSRDARVPGDLDHSRATMLTIRGYRHALSRRCPDAVRSWLEEGLPRWRDTPPEWLTRASGGRGCPRCFGRGCRSRRSGRRMCWMPR